MSRLRPAFAVLLALTLSVVGAFEVVQEFVEGEPLTEMLDDLVMFFAGVLGLAFLGSEYLQQRRALAELGARLETARGQLARIDASSRQVGRQYRDVIQKQFDAWKLTSSEQDVVLGMLKGLTMREIAELRETREKTVRQQAAAVYRKAGVKGRHELAAWFFEDLLDPPMLSIDRSSGN